MAFADDAGNFDRVVMTRSETGVLVMRLHSDGGPLMWDLDAQLQLARAFEEVAHDRGNRVVVLTGTGDVFSGPRVDPTAHGFFHDVKLTPSQADPVFVNGRRLVNALLNVGVPMIAAVNGPAMRHSDLALMCDIVIAADHASFEDTAHFHLGSIVPGDGISTVYTLLIGLNRARYLHLTGQILNARQALDLGLVSELHPLERLAPRALELAEQLAHKPDMLLRHTRTVLVQPLRQAIERDLQHFMALECLAAVDRQ